MGAPRVVDRSTREARLRALLRSGFGPGLPRRETDRYILLHTLAQLVGPDEALGEKDVTARLAAWLAADGARLETDPVTLRRALIDDGFLARDDRGAAYRRSRAHERNVVFADDVATGLATEGCVPCHAGAPQVSDDEARELLAELPGWSIETVGGIPRLSRAFRLPDFAAALALANRVGAEAEAHGHHPELKVEWGRLTVGWWTHAIGGLHRNDFVMAARTDRLADSPTPPRAA